MIHFNSHLIWPLAFCSFLLTGAVLQAQPRVSVDASAIWNSNWNRGIGDFTMPGAPRRLDVDVPFALGLRGEYLFGRLAPYVRAQWLQRRMTLLTRTGSSASINHNTYEFQTGATWYIPVATSTRLFVGLGGGIDLMAPGSDRLSVNYLAPPMTFGMPIAYPGDVVQETFSIRQTDNLNWSSSARFGIENIFGKWGGIQWWFEVHIQWQHSYSYQLENTFGSASSKLYRAHYGAAGISWVLPNKQATME
ncbi:MAG: hypothetical protein EA392_07165 [Cryomorphaceae bacterium]|nr:MAG: hypothetical protein EA392_07165 [Cryomorphaceae bacterium]